MRSKLATVAAIIGGISSPANLSVSGLNAQAASNLDDVPALLDHSINSTNTSSVVEAERRHVALADKLKELARDTNFNGGVVLTEGTETIVSELYGTAKSNPDIRFDLCSVSKSLVGLGVLNLVDNGAITLDTKLSQIKFPALIVPEDKRDITVGQLLNHTSGLSEESMILGVNPMSIDALSKLLELPSNSNRPGAQFFYSNTNYFVLAHIIETVSGKTFPDFIRSVVAPGIGIEKLKFRNDLKDTELNTLPLGFTSQGATGITVSLKEGEAILHALSKHCAGVVSPQSFSTFCNSRAPGYGCGMYVAKTEKGETLLFHSGADGAGSSSFIISNLDSGRGALIVGHRKMVGEQVIQALENPTFVSAIVGLVSDGTASQKTPDAVSTQKLEVLESGDFSTNTEYGKILMSVAKGPNGSLQLSFGGAGALQLCPTEWSPNGDFVKYSSALARQLSGQGDANVDQRLAKFLKSGFMVRSPETKSFMGVARSEAAQVCTIPSPFEGSFVYSLISYPSADQLLVLGYKPDLMSSLLDGQNNTGPIELPWIIPSHVKWLSGFIAPSALAGGNQWIGSLAVTGNIMPRAKNAPIGDITCPPTYLSVPTIHADVQADSISFNIKKSDGTNQVLRFVPQAKEQLNSSK